MSDAIIQLFAIVALVVLAGQHYGNACSAKGRADRAICLIFAVLPLVQLIPLPPSIWKVLPGRQPLDEATALLNAASAWRPLSVATEATWLSVLSILPALAVFWAVSRLDNRRRRWLSLLALGVGALSVLVGLLQVAQGPNSPLRFYPITNPTEAVGFFANRNHFAALLYVLLLLAAAWSIQTVNRFTRTPRRHRFDPQVILPMLGAVALVIVIVATQTFTRSRAGLGLTIAALLGAALLSVGRIGGGHKSFSSRVVMGAGMIGVVLAIQFALYRILERFDADPLADARIPFARNTLEAAMAHFPFGSGLGSFVPVYGLFEPAKDAILDTFANRAHNDFLEFGLETGVLGMVMLVIFAIWFVARGTVAWRASSDAGSDIDVLLPRAATMAVALLLVHALVDYPLRTAAILTMFAFACGLLVPAAHDATARINQRPTPPPPQKPSSNAPGERSATRSTISDWPQIPFDNSPATNPAVQPAPTTPGDRWRAPTPWPQAWLDAPEQRHNARGHFAVRPPRDLSDDDDQT
ncbi:MAG: O-antigen ligase family protein [Hyphomicrobiaceae bacterium]